MLVLYGRLTFQLPTRVCVRGLNKGLTCVCVCVPSRRLLHFDVHGLLQRLTAATAASWPSAAEPASQRWPVCSSARISCTGARRSRTKTAAGGPDHRSMPPAYRQACSHDQHRRLQRNPAGPRVTADHCGPCRFALPAATRTKCACPSSWLKVVRRSNRLHGHHVRSARSLWTGETSRLR